MKKNFTLFVLLTVFFQNAFGQDLYSPNSMTIIEINFQESNWDEILDGYFADGNNQRLVATVDINGQSFDSVGVRYRGSGTFDPTLGKNPLNIKLDHLKIQNYDGYETLKLNNGASDPSFLREVLSYEIANEYMKAPRANYAKVFVNGSYHGVYVNVETVDKDLMSDKFLSDKQNTFFNASPSDPYNPPVTPPFGCTLSNNASLQYVGSSAVCYIEYYEIESNFGWDDLATLAQVVTENPGDVETVLNIDRAIWMSAFNNLLVNLDSYLGALTKNYYLFKGDNGQFNTVVWDLNESMGGFQLLELGQSPLSLTELQNLDPELRAGDATRPLMKLIFENPVYRRQYYAHYRTMLSEIINSGWYATRAQELFNLIDADLQLDPNKVYTYDQFTDNLNSTVQITNGGNTIDVPGISELMNARLTFLQGHSEFMKTPPVISNITSAPLNLTPNSTVTITAEVSGADYVYLGNRANLVEAFQKTEMFDDGAHGDGAAGDGVYGASVTIGTGGIEYYIYAEDGTADVGVFSPQRAEHEYYSLFTYGDLVINEFQASNSTTQPDQNGQYDDWIEIYNNTSTPIDLTGHFLTDNIDFPTKFEFPDLTLDGNSYVIVWADNDITQQGLHAAFKLAGSGERIYLLDPNQQILDEIIFGEQITDRTTGRYPNGTGDFVDMPATFNAQNTIETSTSNLAKELGLKIYPNPAQDFLILEIDQEDIFVIDLYNAFGQKIKTISLNQKSQINVSDLQNGMYFLSFENRWLGKIVISK